jgi:subtilisin family serine protease
LEQPLIDYLATATPFSKISVVVVLTNQLSDEHKRTVLSGIIETDPVLRKKKQRDALMAALQNVATNSQPLLIHLLNLQSNGTVRLVRPLWLSNAIGMEAPTNVIYSLATSNDVDHIHLDLPRRITLGQAGGVSPNMTPSLNQIHADKVVPSPGAKPVVVAVLDSGVKIGHPDLARHIWTNTGEFGPVNGDVNGWNFSRTGNNDLSDPEKRPGHGTPVAGIIAGDGKMGTRTGVATNAQLMVLRFDFEADLTTEEQECWAAMEYAMKHGAHIINFSCAFIESNNMGKLENVPDYATWRTQVQQLTDGGVLFVAAAGQGDVLNVPTNVPIPARVPAALAVGAIVAVTPSDDETIDGASVGPVTWRGVNGFNDYPYPPGLLKPDLVAPGKNVKSVKNGGGNYTGPGKLLIGTSFAAPFATGVAALLLSEEPGLTPYDLRFILEETALPKGGAGLKFPNTSNGWGSLDAVLAVDYFRTNWANVTAKPYNLAAVNGSLLLTNGLTLVCASVTNTAGEVVGNVQISFYFNQDQTATISDLNNGNPNSKFLPIGSYYVPLVGQTGSKHDNFQGCVLWTPPSGFTQGRFGVWVRAGASAKAEGKTSDNGIVFTASNPGP